MNEMKKFVEKYLYKNRELRILDVGSYDVNGCYKELFNNPGWEYFGLDFEEGPNVDFVSRTRYEWDVIGHFDVIISGQCLEHVEDTHKWIRELVSHLKPYGIVCVIAPWTFNEHKYPVDCWRVLPDGMTFLLNSIGGLLVLDAYKNDIDCVGIASMPGIAALPPPPQ